MHTLQPESVMTSFRQSKSDSDEADNSTHKGNLPKNTWMRVAEFAYEENCSIEEAITRCGVVDHASPQGRDQVETAAKSASSQGETAMSRLRRMQNRLSSFGDESEQEVSSAKEDTASRLERAKACLAELNAKKASAPTASNENETREETESSTDFGEMLSGYDTPIENDAISEEEHTVAEGETSLMDVRDVLSDYETLLGMMPEETSAAEEDADGGLSMFDIAQQSSNP